MSYRVNLTLWADSQDFARALETWDRFPTTLEAQAIDAGSANGRGTHGTPTFIFRSRFHEPKSNERPLRDEARNKGSTPASGVIAVTREGSSLLVHERMRASPGFNSAKLRAGNLSIID